MKKTLKKICLLLVVCTLIIAVLAACGKLNRRKRDSVDIPTFRSQENFTLPIKTKLDNGSNPMFRLFQTQEHSTITSLYDKIKKIDGLKAEQLFDSIQITDITSKKQGSYILYATDETNDMFVLRLSTISIYDAEKKASYEIMGPRLFLEFYGNAKPNSKISLEHNKRYYTDKTIGDFKRFYEDNGYKTTVSENILTIEEVLKTDKNTLKKVEFNFGENYITVQNLEIF